MDPVADSDEPTYDEPTYDELTAQVLHLTSQAAVDQQLITRGA